MMCIVISDKDRQTEIFSVKMTDFENQIPENRKTKRQLAQQRPSHLRNMFSIFNAEKQTQII